MTAGPDAEGEVAMIDPETRRAPRRLTAREGYAHSGVDWRWTCERPLDEEDER
jgi:hypothetical protein